MSQHEIEDVVADSILLLHAHHTGDDHRDLFRALLTFQGENDCGFTHGRMLHALIARRYTYRLPVSVHPEYAKHATKLDRMAKKKSEFVFVDSEVLKRKMPEDEHPGVGNENGYLGDGALYCDAGTPLFHALVASGALTGDDAIAPRATPLGSAALRVARVAEQKGDLELIAYWLNFGPWTLFPRFERVLAGTTFGTSPFTGKPFVVEEDYDRSCEPTVEDLEASADAVALRDLGKRVDSATVHVHYDYRTPPEHRSDAERWLWG